MKNNFDPISNCSRLHIKIHDSIAALNAHKFIVEKTTLIVVDGVFSSYKWVGDKKDQRYVDVANQLLVGTDPVTIDYLGWQMIEELRRYHDLKPIQPEPKFIQKAAVNFGLGNADIKRINLIDI